MLPNYRKPDETKAGYPGSSPPALQPAVPQMTRPIGSPLRTGERGNPSVIGAELQITGNLVSRGEIQIEGEVNGDIHAYHVIVGEKATVTGGVIADEVVVRGHVMGSVRGKRVLLQSSSHVEGDVYHLTLAIEQGAYFEGKSRRTEDPTAGFALPSRSTANSQPESPPPLSDDAANESSA